jgi:hypothetical protein
VLVLSYGAWQRYLKAYSNFSPFGITHFQAALVTAKGAT